MKQNEILKSIYHHNKDLHNDKLNKLSSE